MFSFTIVLVSVMNPIKRRCRMLVIAVGGLFLLFMGWYFEINTRVISRIYLQWTKPEPYTTIGVIAPYWSDNANISTVKSSPAFKDFILAVLKKRSHMYSITVYLPVERRVQERHIKIAARLSVKFVFICNGTSVKTINILARAAYIDKMNYILRLSHKSLKLHGWNRRLETGVFALVRTTPRQVGVVVPVPSGRQNWDNAWELVHRTHLDIFFNYFPPDLNEQNGHHWITHVYQNKMCFFLGKDVPLANATYEDFSGNETLQLMERNDRHRILHYLANNGDIDITVLRTLANITNQQFHLGAVVVMAPRRNQGMPGFHGTVMNQKYDYALFGARFCLFQHMIQSVDKNLNEAQTTYYPIYVIVAADPFADPENLDAPYTVEDREEIKRLAPNSNIKFVEINMYTKDALTEGTTREQIMKWDKGEEGAVAGRPLGYRSMCRAWSGRIQRMPFLQKYKYYMRLDDDSLFLRPLSKDPFKEMDRESLQYAYIRRSNDPWGYNKLQNISLPYGNLSGTYVPYTNFHIARTDFFRTDAVLRYWDDLERSFAFYKYRVGDATLHGALLDLFMSKKDYAQFSWIPYGHNSNDIPGYPPKHWFTECGNLTPNSRTNT